MDVHDHGVVMHFDGTSSQPFAKLVGKGESGEIQITGTSSTYVLKAIPYQEGDESIKWYDPEQQELIQRILTDLNSLSETDRKSFLEKLEGNVSMLKFDLDPKSEVITKSFGIIESEKKEKAFRRMHGEAKTTRGVFAIFKKIQERFADKVNFQTDVTWTPLEESKHEVMSRSSSNASAPSIELPEIPEALPEGIELETIKEQIQKKFAPVLHGKEVDESRKSFMEAEIEKIQNISGMEELMEHMASTEGVSGADLETLRLAKILSLGVIREEVEKSEGMRSPEEHTKLLDTINEYMRLYRSKDFEGVATLARTSKSTGDISLRVMKELIVLDSANKSPDEVIDALITMIKKDAETKEKEDPVSLLQAILLESMGHPGVLPIAIANIKNMRGIDTFEKWNKKVHELIKNARKEGIENEPTGALAFKVLTSEMRKQFEQKFNDIIASNDLTAEQRAILEKDRIYVVQEMDKFEGRLDKLLPEFSPSAIAKQQKNVSEEFVKLFYALAFHSAAGGGKMRNLFDPAKESIASISQVMKNHEALFGFPLFSSEEREKIQSELQFLEGVVDPIRASNSTPELTKKKKKK